jgi:5'-nucleotidase
VRFYTGADLVILNSGFLRSDCVLDKGLISLEILEKMIPIMDVIIVLEISGADLITALEAGVCKYPSYDGRFPVVSGIEFTFVGNEEPSKRVNAENVFIGGQKLQLDKLYSLAVKSFIGNGKY